MERERQGDEENKEEDETAAEGQSVQAVPILATEGKVLLSGKGKEKKKQGH